MHFDVGDSVAFRDNFKRRFKRISNNRTFPVNRKVFNDLNDMVTVQRKSLDDTGIVEAASSHDVVVDFGGVSVTVKQHMITKI